MNKITIELAEPVEMSRVARDARLFNRARDLWIRHPLLEEASNVIAAHLSLALPGRDDTLLKDCLIDAMAGVVQAERENLDVVPAYVLAMLRRATDVFDLSVRAAVPEGAIAWDPLTEPLGLFCTRYRGVEIAVMRVEREESDQYSDESTLLLGVRLMPEFIGRHLVRQVLSRHHLANA